jgi:hypothetical protein
MNNHVNNFEDFLNEAKVSVKRQYTALHPAKYVSSHGPIREKVLAFVKENGEVSQKDLFEFFKGMNEETGGTTSRKWLNKNPHYFKVTEKNGVKTYKLSKLGERVHNAIQQLNKI